MDPLLLNGKKPVTAIQRFDHSVVLIDLPKKNRECDDLHSLMKFVEENNLVISVQHIHPAGAPGKK
jgi:hypothetical protein